MGWLPGANAYTPRTPQLVIRTSGDFTLNNTTFTEVSSTLRLTIPDVVEGDVISLSVSGLVGSEAPGIYFDGATIVSGAITNRFSGSSTQGSMAWFCSGNALRPLSGAVFYTVVAGDISAGSVIVSLVFRTASAANRTLYASSASNAPLQLAAINHG